jgi:hypothetical protein
MLEAGTLHWERDAGDRMRVRLQYVPASRIEVGIWWNRASGHPDVQLIFGMYAGYVELGCLRGNGYDRPALHRAGFGTLSVNVAVQALRGACAPGMPVDGVLSNTDEIDLPAPERLRLEANRRAFWRRFGLDIVQRGDPALDFLRGRVADLRTVEYGQVAGQFPRYIDLADFQPD